MAKKINFENNSFNLKENYSNLKENSCDWIVQNNKIKYLPITIYFLFIFIF